MVLEVKKIAVPSSLGAIAYGAIKESILTTDVYQMPEEGRLDERDLASSLGVSRTPLREAINRLVTEGFLKVVPRKGVYVVKKSKDEIIEILMVRAALEGMAARLAAENVTKKEIQMMKDIFSPFKTSNLEKHLLKYSDANIKFHELILKISKCGKLIELAGNLFDHIRMIRFRTISFIGRPEKSFQEHQDIIELLEKKNPDLAEKKMREHIEGLARHVKDNVESLP